MSSNKRNTDTTIFDAIEPYSLVTDLLKSLWAMVLGALAAAMLVMMFFQSSSQQSYTSSAIFAVMSKTGSGNSYNNVSAASSMASDFSSILQSDLLKKKVCEDIGVDSYEATTSATVIDETNLLTLSVTSSSPQLTYKIIQSIIKNYSSVTQYVSNNAVMEVLQAPNIPAGGNNTTNYKGRAKQAFGMTFLVLLAVFAVLSVRHDTIKSEKDMYAKVDGDFLGSIEHASTPLTWKNLLGHRKSGVLVNDVSASFGYTENYKKIAASLVEKAEKYGGAKVILVASVAEHEGKSTVAANLALTLQQQGHSTILVDGDLRRPSQQALFHKKVKVSMPDMLKRGADITLETDKSTGLRLLLSNPKGYANSTDIVSSHAFKRMIEALKNAADYVVIDSPPLALMADAEAMASVSDMSVLVVQYNRVLAGDINDAIDSLKGYRCHMAGCILNDLHSFSGVVSGGYGGYGTYGGYGRYGAYGRYGKYGHYGTKSSSAEVKHE